MAIEIGTTKQLFVDDYIVEQTESLSRAMHQPEKHPGNPILRAEMCWEKPSVYLWLAPCFVTNLTLIKKEE